MGKKSSKIVRKYPLTQDIPNWKVSRTSGGQWLCPFVFALLLQPFHKNLLLSVLSLKELYFNPVWSVLYSNGTGYIAGFHQPQVFLRICFLIQMPSLESCVWSGKHESVATVRHKKFFSTDSFWLYFLYEVWMSFVGSLCSKSLSRS